MGKKRKRKKAKGGDQGLGHELDRGTEEAPKAKKPVKVGTSFKELLRGVDLKKKEAPGGSKPASPGARTGAAAKDPIAAQAEAWKERQKKKKPLSEEKKELLGISLRPRPSEGLKGQHRVKFAQAFAGVRPLEEKQVGKKGKGSAQRVPPPSPAAEAGPLDKEARERLAALVGGGVRFEMDRNADGEIMGLRVNGAPGVLRELGSPQATAEASLDLHGLLGDEAEREVTRFLRKQHQAGKRRLRIVHGKGLHSEGGMGVLEERAIHALTEGLSSPLVFAFRSAAKRNGGLGALMVQLVRK